MARLLLTLLGNAAGIYAAAQFIDGFDFTGSYFNLAIAAAVFTLINWTIRPITKLISGPLILLTLGLFTIIVNMAMLWLLDLVISSLVILNLASLFWATLLISLINLVVMSFKKK